MVDRVLSLIIVSLNLALVARLILAFGRFILLRCPNLFGRRLLRPTFVDFH